MRKKIISIIFLLPVLLIVIFYSVSYVAIGNLIKEPERISFKNSISFLKVGETNKLSVDVFPTSDKFNDDILYETDRSDIVEISGNNVKALKQGSAQINASYPKTNIQDTMNLITYTENSKDIYVFDALSSSSGIKTYNGKNISSNYGQFDYDENMNKVEGKAILKAYDLNNSIEIDGEIVPGEIVGGIKVKSGAATIKYIQEEKSYYVSILGSEDVVLSFFDLAKKEYQYVIDVIPNGINIYSYMELLYATNHSNEHHSICLRKNIESFSNSFNNLSNETLFKNTSIFGLNEEEYQKMLSFQNYNPDTSYLYLKRSFNQEDYYVEYLNERSTYDTRYVDKLYGSEDTKFNRINIGIKLKGNLHGNGFHLNFDNLTYPSGSPNFVNNLEIPTLSKNDVFKGAIPQIGLSAKKYNSEEYTYLAKVLGEDNISLAIENQNNLMIDNVILKSCDNVESLSQLTYVGTTLSIKNSNNISIENSIIANGKNVIVSYSNSGVLIDNSLIQNGKDYLIKLGNNEFKEFDSYVDSLNGNYMENDKIGNKMTINNSYFARSGFFSIGFSSLFNGTNLYGGDFASLLLNGTNPLGGIEKGTKLTISGNTTFYDFKDIKTISNEAIFEINKSAASDMIDPDSINITNIIKKELQKEENKKFIFNDQDGNTYLNTSLFYQGGGINNSTLIEDTSNINDLGLEYLGPMKLDEGSFIGQFAGYNPFNFYLYPQNNIKNIGIDSYPNIVDLMENI